MTAPPARVVLVGRGAPERGGIPTFLQLMVAGAEQLGHEVVFVNLAPTRLGGGGRLSSSNLLRTVSDTRRVRRTTRPGDIVHVHSALAPTVTSARAGLLVRAGRSRGAHVVVHAHGGRLIGSLDRWWRRAVLRWALAAADRVVAVSHGVRDELVAVGVPPERVLHLANGVSVDLFAPPDATTGGRTGSAAGVTRVLFVGGLTPRKGVLDLAAASREALAAGADHELWLVGGVPDEGGAAYQEVIASLPDHVVLKGQVDPDDMPDLYRQVDLFCLPSWWEAMPLTVLEAQASGLPVIVSAVGDLPTMVEDGVTGRVVPARDRAALGAALHELISDPDARVRMGRQGREHVRDHFDLRHTFRELDRIFLDVSAGGTGPGRRRRARRSRRGSA